MNRIVIDYQSAIGLKSGVGYYVYHLAQSLSKIDSGLEINLAYFDFHQKAKFINMTHNVKLKRSPFPGKLFFGLWKYISWPDYSFLFGKANLFHFPNFVMRPVQHGKSIVTIHDLSFLRFPQYTEVKNLNYLTSQLDRTLEQVDHVIVDSEFTKQELMELKKYPENNITVVHLGIDSLIKRELNTQKLELVKQKYKLPNEYYLFIGNVEPRKNLKFLLECFEKCENKQNHLVIAGMYGWKYAQIIDYWKSMKLKNNIHFIGYIDDDDKSSIYTLSKALIYPSIYEGFGFPPLEAMRCHVPVIASLIKTTHEISGKYVRYFNLENHDSLIQLLMNQNNICDSEYLLDAYIHSEKYKWDVTAQKTLDIYNQVLK